MGHIVLSRNYLKKSKLLTIMEREVILRRLAFIKYLFTQAKNQSTLPDPLNASSVLMFHDAVELFLQLCAEELNVNTDNVSFMGYWEKLKPKLVELRIEELTQKEGMRRLNKARVSLKHHGILPSKSDINDFKVLTESFLIENSKNIFNMDIKEASLIELISYTKTKENLLIAKNSFEEKKFSNAIKHLALAFEFLIHDYESSKQGRFGQSPFFFGRDMTFLGSSFMGLDRSTKLSEFVDNVKESIESIQKAVKILSFGIDYRKYVKFSMLTPKPRWAIGSTEPIVSISNNAKISKEEFEFCFDFIIESALKLQEFDFEVSI